MRTIGVAFLVLVLPGPLAGQTYTVTSTGDGSDTDLFDGICDDGTGACTLRAAIQQANATGGTATIQFAIAGAGPHTILPSSALPVIGGPVVIDGYTQPGSAPATPTTSAVLMIELDGSNVVTNTPGLTIRTANSTVRGLAINLFGGPGIRIEVSGGNLIEGNLIGPDITGGRAGVQSNTDGVVVASSGNTIGGVTPAARNVISSNDANGLDIAGADNIVQGNFIGTNVTGTGALPNRDHGVRLVGANNLVGGTTAAARNIISGNVIHGVALFPGSGNRVQGNYIGTDVTGTVAVPNSAGVLINNGSDNVIGGTTAGARNIISGNNQVGVGIFGTAARNVVQGNFLGTDVTGALPLGNGGDGVSVLGAAQDNLIGGTTAATRNIIAANAGSGVLLTGTTPTGNRIQGNFIGTDVTGTVAFGNGLDGIRISLGADNTIGGTTSGAGNLISGNSRDGVRIDGDATRSVVQGNFIGTDVSGTSDLGNTASGVAVFNASDNTIGGDVAGARNVISGNDEHGVAVFTSGPNPATGNVVLGNFIGTDASGTAALGNSSDGVSVTLGASNTTIGGSTLAARNVISGNGNSGVRLFPSTDATAGHVVQGNFIGTDASGTAPLGNGLHGVAIVGQLLSHTIGGVTPGSGNVISGNQENGIDIPQSSGNVIQGNRIGTDATGSVALGNRNGIVIGLRNNTIGGTSAAARNVISGNQGTGVVFGSAAAEGNLVQGNFIGTNAAGTADLGNTDWGILLTGQSNTVGGAAAGAGNVVSGNGRSGVSVQGGATANAIQGNFIGTDASGTAAISNDESGVVLLGSVSNNTVGGTTAGAGNIISGNADHGVLLRGPLPTGNLVQGNFVGTQADGISPLGNASHGISIEFFDADNNTIGGTDPGAGNTIAFNGGAGVAIGDDAGFGGDKGIGNAILANSIYSNAGLGIDLLPVSFGAPPLGPTPNDPGDGDVGANNLQNFPVVGASAVASTTVQGTLNSTPNTTFRLEFFSNSTCDASGFGEGESFIGSTDVTTDPGGDASFSATFATTVPAGQFITATATDPDNNTSEFSRCSEVLAPPDGGQIFAIIPQEIPSFPEKLARIDVNTGALTVRFDPPANGNGVGAGIAFDGNTIYYLPGFPGDDRVFRLDATGNVLGVLNIPSSARLQGLEFLNGSLFVGTSLNEILEVDPNSGTLKNTFNRGAESAWTMGDNGESYRFLNFVADGPSIQVLDLATGTELRRFPTPDGLITAALGWDDGNLVVFGFGNRLSRVDPLTGTELSFTTVQFGVNESILSGLTSIHQKPAGPPDQDGDGIEDAIDPNPAFSNDFTDGATTLGTISNRGDQTLLVTDEADPTGVRITADPSGGPIPATVSVCGLATLSFGPGDEVVVTCSSALIEVVSGPLEVSVHDFDLALPTGTVALVTAGDDGSITVDNQSPPDTDPIVVSVDGQVVSEIGPGESAVEGRLDVKLARVHRHRKPNRDRFGALGRMVLGPDNNGLDARNENISVAFDGFSETLPVDERYTIALRRATLVFDERVSLIIWNNGGFGISVRNLDLGEVDLPEPIAFTLRIGDDLARMAIPFNRHGWFIARHGHTAAAPPDELPGDNVDIGVVDGPDLDLEVAPERVAVAPGESATYDVVLSPLGVFFDQELKLSCSGLPAGAACSFEPSTVIPDEAGATSVLTVSTNGRSAAASPPPNSRRLPTVPVWLALAAFLLASMALGRPRAAAVRMSRYAAAMLLLLAALATACDDDVTAPARTTGTPHGIYQFTITATAADLERTFTVGLTVGEADEGERESRRRHVPQDQRSIE